MYTFSIKGQGVDPLLVGLPRLLRLTDDLSTAWPVVTQELREITREQFDSQGGAGATGAWAPLSEKYAARKARLFPGRPILVRTGSLKSSLTGQTSQSVIQATPRSLYFGSSVPYGIYHQTGTGKMPRRPVFAFSNRQAARIGSVLHKWLGREMARALAGARAA